MTFPQPGFGCDAGRAPPSQPRTQNLAPATNVTRQKSTYPPRGTVQTTGATSDFSLSPRRDVAAAKLFFRKALKTQGRPPRTITLDGYAASHRAVRELPEENGLWKDTKLRSSKHLNNIIEQDFLGVKARVDPMLGFKRFRRAKVTIAGIELLHCIRKNQFSLSKLPKHATTAPAIWNAVLAA